MVAYGPPPRGVSGGPRLWGRRRPAAGSCRGRAEQASRARGFPHLAPVPGCAPLGAILQSGEAPPRSRAPRRRNVVGEFNWDDRLNPPRSRRRGLLGLDSASAELARRGAVALAHQAYLVRVTISATRTFVALLGLRAGRCRRRQPPPKRAPAATSSRPPKSTIWGRAGGAVQCLSPSCGVGAGQRLAPPPLKRVPTGEG